MWFKSRSTIPSLAAISFCLIGGTTPAAADILHVPGDYPTIQSAIVAATDGDEVVVAPGTYYENINFLGKAITVRKENGPDTCSIRGGGGNGCSFVSGESSESVLRGFTIWDFERGILITSSSSPTIVDCRIVGNTQGDDYAGGGVYIDSSNPTFIGCTISNNQIGIYYDGTGGGLYIKDSSVQFIDCVIARNTAWANDGGGGRGGGVLITGEGQSTFTNCLFDGNRGCYGGGVAVACTSPGFPIFMNCMFINNRGDSCDAKGKQGNGGAIRGGCPTVVNCSFVNNTAVHGGALSTGGVFTNCIIWNNILDQINGSPTVTFSDIEGGFPGTGNIDADPLFVDDAKGDLHLSAGSPCIDAGNNFAVPFFITTDLDGNPRFIDDPNTPDTGLGCLIVDMGSYEFQEGTTVCCPWDLDDDAFVGVSDLLILLAFWGKVDAFPEADLDGDGFVGTSDLLILLANWGPCP